MIIGISGKIQSGKNSCGNIITNLIAQSLSDNKFYYDNIQIHKFPSHPQLCGGWQIKSFADKVKECASLILNIPRGDLEKIEVKNRELGKEWERWYNWHYKAQNNSNIKGKISKYFATEQEADKEEIRIKKELNLITSTGIEQLTIRKFLQEFGTEVGRVIHPDFWINALFSEYETMEKYDSDKGLIIEYAPGWIITDVRFPNELEAIKKRNGISIRINRVQTKLVNVNDLKDDLRAESYFDQHPSETALDNATFDYIIDNNGTIEELIVKVKEILIKEKIL